MSLAVVAAWALLAGLASCAPACDQNGCAAGQICLSSGCVDLCVTGDAGNFGGEGSCPNGGECVANTESCACEGFGPRTCNCPALPSFVCN